MPWIAVYMPKSAEQLIKRFRKIAKTEGKSQSKILTELIIQYITEHEKGNPQTRLDPSAIHYTQVGSLFPLERRYENMEWLKSLIARNPGRTDFQWIHKFSEVSGLKPETVKTYLRTLLINRSVVRRGGKLYARDQVPL